MSILEKLDLGLDSFIKKDGDVIETYNPSNGQLLAKVENYKISHVQQAILNAKSVADEWKKVPAPQRDVRLNIPPVLQHDSNL